MQKNLFIPLTALVLAIGCTSTLPSASTPAGTATPGTAPAAGTFRDQTLGKCRPAVRSFCEDTEKRMAQLAVFVQSPDKAPVSASSIYDTSRNEARISLRLDAREYELAHEFMHFRIDLVDRFSLIVWRRDVVRDPAIDAAFSRIKTYIDDDIVHRRLVKLGFQPDTEVINPLLFDSLYAPASELLEKGEPRNRDGLSHLDGVGRGTLCRAAFLVQAEQIRAQYGKRLTPDHRAKTERFIRAVRSHRPEEAAVADKVLALFAKYDVNTDAGHRAICEGWLKLENLDSRLGMSRYELRDGQYFLPYPDDSGPLRDEMLGKCRPEIRRFYLETEKELLAPIRFFRLSDKDPVAAASRYNPDKDEAQLLVRHDAEDVDIAHELMHFRLDLVDRFTVLAWRRGVTRDPAIENAFARIRTYIDDDIVHRRLVKLGMQPDGEVIRPALFNGLYAPAADNLEKGATREHDGLGHLDASGRGTLCRAAFLIQAEQILAQYGKRLTPDHRAKTERFIRVFRAHRPEESAVADKVLALFAKYDVNTDAGHQTITDGWIEIEGLTPYTGSTRFELRYELPFPPDLKK